MYESFLYMQQKTRCSYKQKCICLIQKCVRLNSNLVLLLRKKCNTINKQLVVGTLFVCFRKFCLLRERNQEFHVYDRQKTGVIVLNPYSIFLILESSSIKTKNARYVQDSSISIKPVYLFANRIRYSMSIVLE